MRVEWTYDNPEGGSVEIDPADFEGMPPNVIRDAIFGLCRDSAKRKVIAYVPELDAAVQFVVESLTEPF